MGMPTRAQRSDRWDWDDSSLVDRKVGHEPAERSRNLRGTLALVCYPS